MSLATRFFKSSLFRTLETVINIGVGLFLLPFMVHRVGTDLYGIWILVTSITATFYLFDLGFASAVTRFISDALAQGDRARAQAVASTARVIYSLLALLVVLATAVLCFLVPVIAPHSNHQQLIQILLAITGLNLAIEFPVKAYAGIAAYHMRYDLLSISRICFKILSTTAVVIALLHGYLLVTIAIIGLVSQFLSNLAFKYIALHLEPEVRISLLRASRAEAKALFSFSAWTLIIDISRILQDRADVWAIGFFLNAQVLTIYYVGLRLADYAFELLSKAVSMVLPLFTRDFARGDVEGLKRRMVLFLRLNFALATLAFTGFVLIGKDFVLLWMGPKFDWQQAYLTGVLLMGGKLLLFTSLPINGAFLAIHRPKTMSFLNIAETALMTVLLLCFVGYFHQGIQSAALAVLLTFVVTRLIVVPILANRVLDLPSRLLANSLWPIAVVSTFAGLAAHFLLQGWVVPDRPQIALKMGVTASIYLAIFGLLIPLILSKEEQNLIENSRRRPLVLLLLWPRKLFTTKGS